MPRHRLVDGKRVEFTAAEEAARDAEEAAWADNALNRALDNLRNKRNELLVETDWMANSDVTMSDAWKTYRQALRDITTQTPKDNALSNIKFPEKPTE